MAPFWRGRGKREPIHNVRDRRALRVDNARQGLLDVLDHGCCLCCFALSSDGTSVACGKRVDVEDVQGRLLEVSIVVHQEGHPRAERDNAGYTVDETGAPTLQP